MRNSRDKLHFNTSIVRNADGTSRIEKKKRTRQTGSSKEKNSAASHCLSPALTLRILFKKIF